MKIRLHFGFATMFTFNAALEVTVRHFYTYLSSLYFLLFENIAKFQKWNKIHVPILMVLSRVIAGQGHLTSQGASDHAHLHLLNTLCITPLA